MQQEDFPIKKEAIEAFVKTNRRQWENGDHGISIDKYVYVNLSMVRMQMAWVIPKLLYAKGIAETLGARVYVITWRESTLLDEVCESFGFSHYCIEHEDKKKLHNFFKAFSKILFFMLRDGSGSNLQRMKLDGFMVGRAIYEDILRTSEFSTIKSGRNKICFIKAVHILWMFYTLRDFCKNHTPIFAIADDTAYHEALISSLFHSLGAKITNSNQEQEMVLGFDENGNPNRMHLMMQLEYRKIISKLGDMEAEEAVKMLKDRFQGKNGRYIDRGAFKDKRVLERDEATRELHLDPKKKNVVIMAHTFTDAVYNYGDLFYRDYYDWTENTLAIAAKNNNVNWILKPHPTRSAYHESQDSIEDMFERFKTPNMFMLSDDVSTESIKNMADTIITIGSNAGGEFACFGIPAVIVGKPYYGKLGFTIEPKTAEEYEQCLMHIEEVKPLTSEQMNIAKKAFYLRNKMGPSILGTKYDDEFGKLINDLYKQMSNEIALAYFESNRGTEKYNTRITEKITEYMKIHDMKECKYFRQGELRAKELI